LSGGYGLVGHNVKTCPITKGKEKAWIENSEMMKVMRKNKIK